MSVPEAKRYGTVECASVAGALESGGNAAALHIRDGRIYNGDKPVTEAFAAIDSFAYSESRGEVAFSAKREGGFDIGLAASDGSKTNWVPADPADEVSSSSVCLYATAAGENQRSSGPLEVNCWSAARL